MATTSIRFNTPAERHNYERGLREVQAKLASAPRRPTAEMIHQKSLLEGLTTIAVVKKLSALVKAGIPPASPRPTITAKAPAPVKAYGTRTRHCYANRNWLPV